MRDESDLSPDDKFCSFLSGEGCARFLDSFSVPNEADGAFEGDVRSGDIRLLDVDLDVCPDGDDVPGTSFDMTLSDWN